MERMYIIKSDRDKVYAPNTERSAKNLVSDYIDGLCLNEPNDKECADWLTSMIEKDTEDGAKSAVGFISTMWGLETIRKETTN